MLFLFAQLCSASCNEIVLWFGHFDVGYVTFFLLFFLCVYCFAFFVFHGLLSELNLDGWMDK